MSSNYRELRYVRRNVADLPAACLFASETFGLMPEDRSETDAFFRSDHRFYSLCLSTELPDAVGFNVGTEEQLAAAAERFETFGAKVSNLEADDISRRLIKKGFSVTAPNGIEVEIVWRHMESGWAYHGSRDTGLSGFYAVQLASSNIEADSEFWRLGAGLSVSDYTGDAQFLSLGDAHHQIALYPSQNDGLLGAVWQVKTIDYVMRHWHFMLNRQVPIAHGPGRQPTSGSKFVTVKADDDFLMSYATEMDSPPELGARHFRNEPKSHCSWGSPSDLPEFGGNAT